MYGFRGMKYDVDLLSPFEMLIHWKMTEIKNPNYRCPSTDRKLQHSKWTVLPQRTHLREVAYSSSHSLHTLQKGGGGRWEARAVEGPRTALGDGPLGGEAPVVAAAPPGGRASS